MNIKEFLLNVSTGLLPKSPVLLFVAKGLSPLLVARLLPLLVRLFELQESVFKTKDEDDDMQQFVASFHLSFLGQRRLYWLGNISEFSASAREILLRTFASYTGPHVIGLVMEPEEVKALKKATEVLHIEIPERLDDTELLQLFAQVLGLKLPDSKLWQKQLSTLSLDGVLLLLSYAEIMDEKSEEFFTTWVPRLCVVEESLFELSKHFFAKDLQRFLHQWKRVGTTYPPEFWVVFWGEQLWQAWLVVRSMQQQGSAPERRFINRLPFSFAQRDWKRYKEREFIAAHNALYQVDYALKNGGDAGALEVLLLRFLTGSFAKT